MFVVHFHHLDLKCCAIHCIHILMLFIHAISIRKSSKNLPPYRISFIEMKICKIKSKFGGNSHTHTRNTQHIPIDINTLLFYGLSNGKTEYRRRRKKKRRWIKWWKMYYVFIYKYIRLLLSYYMNYMSRWKAKCIPGSMDTKSIYQMFENVFKFGNGTSPTNLEDVAVSRNSHDRASTFITRMAHWSRWLSATKLIGSNGTIHDLFETAFLRRVDRKSYSLMIFHLNHWK